MFFINRVNPEINVKVMFTVLGLILLGACSDVHAWRKGAGYLSLKDKLDRPEDGYCLDVAGSGDWVNVDIPLNAHNCKGPQFYADEAVVFDESEGLVFFPAYKRCMTAVGRNGRSLPKTPLVLLPCANQPESNKTAFNAISMQTFVHRGDGRIELSGSGLCLSVGEHSDTTFSPAHKWRSLYLDICSDIPERLSVWNTFKPH